MRTCVGIDVAKIVHWAVGIEKGSLVAELRGLQGEVVIGLDVVSAASR